MKLFLELFFLNYRSKMIISRQPHTLATNWITVNSGGKFIIFMGHAQREYNRMHCEGNWHDRADQPARHEKKKETHNRLKRKLFYVDLLLLLQVISSNSI